MNIRLPLTFMFLTLQYTCTLPITNWYYEIRSPDGRARAVVRSRGLKPHRIELRVESQGNIRTVFTHDYSDVDVGFCELHWTPDSRIVEMLTTNKFEAYTSIFAYDVVGDHAVDVDWAIEDLRRSISQEYSLKPSVDVLKWVHSFQAQDLFYERRTKVSSNN